MNRSMQDDFKQDGLVSQLMRRIQKLEEFERWMRLQKFGGGGNFTLIDDQVLAAPSANFTFSAIPGIYKHLHIISSLRSPGVTGVGNVRFNGDATNVYSSLIQFINTAAVGNIEVINGTAGDFVAVENVGGIANAFRPASIFIPDYAGANFKSWTGTAHAPASGTAGNIYNFLIGGHWKKTDAITDIVITEKGGGNFVAGSRATLYGLS